MRNLWKSADDPSRCDFHLRSQAGVTTHAPAAAPGIITEPAGAPGIITEPAGVPLITEPAGVPLIAEPDGVPPHVINVCELARRQPASTRDQFEARKAYTITAANSACDVPHARDLVVVQDDWDRYLREIKDLCSEQFWTFFLRLHRFSGVMIDTSLSSAKKVFRNLQSNDAWKQFPASRRTLLGEIAKLREFWSQVTHSVKIDLSQFKLPSGTKEVEFHFLDPCWSWLVAARRQHPLDLHWKPRSQPRLCPVYGGGCQFGEAMAQACQSCPPGTYPMCVTLHWDGTSGRGMSCTPICVGVGNTNICDPSAEFCIGYMSHVVDFGIKSFRDKAKACDVKFYIRNRCAAAILHVLETGAVSGVRCRLRNIENVEIERVLFPRLVAMNFDQPEAQLFYGMQNKQSCGRCLRRKGYSAFRRSRLHKGSQVKLLYSIANDPKSPHRVTAIEKLMRWGFNYKRRCCLLYVCDKLLVRMPGKDEVYPCLDMRDSMHGIMMLCHRALYETLADIPLSASEKLILDSRLACVGKRGCLRSSENGSLYRVQKTVFDDVGMTAVDKVCCIFLLAHVLGPTADIIPDERLRYPLLTAVAWAQLLNIAVRGLRSYNEMELRTIFDTGYINLFGALEFIRQVNYEKRCELHAAKVLRESVQRAEEAKRSKEAVLFVKCITCCCIVATLLSISLLHCCPIVATLYVAASLPHRCPYRCYIVLYNVATRRYIY